MDTAATSVGKQESRKTLLNGEFWRRQAIDHIMPLWLDHAIDKDNGGFHTNISREWKVTGPDDKYPAMLGRHIFSLSAAYLLSGQEKFLGLAEENVRYLIRNGWDHDSGGWYKSLTVSGKPKDTIKNAFTQMYANTGLAMYYFVTRNTEALSYLEKSNNIFEKKALDINSHGYYTELNKDLSIASSNKAFNPQIGILSSYGIYTYLATQNKVFLSQMERSMDVALHYMQSPGDFFILDEFDRDWKNIPRKWKDGTEIVGVGGNIETVWVLIRLYHLTGKKLYKEKALDLARQMLQNGWDKNYSGWYESFARNQTGRHAPDKYWFIQNYGNFMVLNLYNLTGDERYLELFHKTSVFWNKYFTDSKYGGEYLRVSAEGKMIDGTKGTASKGSYHSIEHALLNYLYLNLYVQKKKINLFFNITSGQPVDSCFVCPVEDPFIHITGVTVNGKPWESFDQENGVYSCIRVET